MDKLLYFPNYAPALVRTNSKPITKTRRPMFIGESTYWFCDNCDRLHNNKKCPVESDNTLGVLLWLCIDCKIKNKYPSKILDMDMFKIYPKTINCRPLYSNEAAFWFCDKCDPDHNNLKTKVISASADDELLWLCIKCI